MADDDPVDTDTDAQDVAAATGVPADGGGGDGPGTGGADPGGGPDPIAQGGGLDVDAAEARLGEVGKEIEEGRRALADVEQEVEPEPEGPPIAAGEGAANAPPG